MHALLIAAIFTAYMGSMASLIAYACCTGRESRFEEEPGDTEDCDPGPALIPLAASA